MSKGPATITIRLCKCKSLPKISCARGPNHYVNDPLYEIECRNPKCDQLGFTGDSEKEVLMQWNEEVSNE